MTWYPHTFIFLTLRVRSAVGKDMGFRPMQRCRWWSLRRMGMDCVNPAWGESQKRWIFVIFVNSQENSMSHQGWQSFSWAAPGSAHQRIQSPGVLHEPSTTFNWGPFCSCNKRGFGYVQRHPSMLNFISFHLTISLIQKLPFAEEFSFLYHT